jgi:hypothetical protein
MKRRAGNQFRHFMGLRIGAGVNQHCRCDSRVQCKPALHDATSGFILFIARVFVRTRRLANETSETGGTSSQNVPGGATDFRNVGFYGEISGC